MLYLRCLVAISNSWVLGAYPGGPPSGGRGTGSDGSGGEGVRASWQDAISSYQFAYYYNVSDYSERISFIFCGSGDDSYSWSINSGGTTGTGSDSGGEDGTWELGETTGSAARIELVGDESGRVDLIMTVDSGGSFYIDDARYYREWYGC